MRSSKKFLLSSFDIVYVQAKRYKEDSKIGSPDLQKFCGALSGKQASKGIFFTTSDFSREAIEDDERLACYRGRFAATCGSPDEVEVRESDEAAL